MKPKASKNPESVVREIKRKKTQANDLNVSLGI
jgi:hypothetical protein